MNTDENVVADNWEDGGADAVKAIEKRFEQVKILQRKQEDKDALIEKTKIDTVDDAKSAPKILTKIEDDSVAEGPGPSQEEPKRVLLRRPKDGSSEISNGHTNHGSHHHRGRQQNTNPPPQRKTLEERQAEYKEARVRILGSEYKPDNSEIKEIVVVERSKSPETITLSRASSAQKLPSSYERDYMVPSGMNMPPQHQPQLQNGRPQYGQEYGMNPQSQAAVNIHHESSLHFEMNPFMPPPGFGSQQIPANFSNDQRLYSQMNGCYNAQNQQQMYENAMKLQMAAAAAVMMNTQQMQNMENHNAQQHFSFPNQTNYNMLPYGMPPQYQSPNTQLPPNYSQPPPPKPQNGPMLYSQAISGNGQSSQQRPPQLLQPKKRNSNGASDIVLPYPPNFNYPPPQPSMGQHNPVPFGCPPRSVNKYSGHQQSQMAPNHGLGLMGPPPQYMNQGQMGMNVQTANGMMRNGPMRQGAPNQ